MKITATSKTLEVLQSVAKNPYVLDKIKIQETYKNIGRSVNLPANYCKKTATANPVLLGDDCTAIPAPNGGYTLFAAEGMITEFLDSDPWFAGYSAIMVNISDVLSMGGDPVAVTDVIWGKDPQELETIWEGMQAASKAYDVPIVGGHTCYGSSQKALAVSILGHAQNLLTSFDAAPGQSLLMAVDMNGAYYKNHAFWNASTSSHAADLRLKCSILPQIADEKLAFTAKDISMGGLLGTIAMLSHTSEVGFNINIEDVLPAPDEDLEKWLVSFPSFGYILTCDRKNEEKIKQLFKQAGVSCSTIGKATPKEAGIKINYDNTSFQLI